MKNQSSDVPALTGEQNSRFLVEMSHFFCLPLMADEAQSQNHGIIHKDHPVPILALHRTTPKIPPCAWQCCPNALSTLAGLAWPKSQNNEEWDIARNNQSKTKKCEKDLLPWKQCASNWCQTFCKIISLSCKMQWWRRRQKEASSVLFIIFFIYLLACVVCIYHTHTPTHSTQLSLSKLSYICSRNSGGDGGGRRRKENKTAFRFGKKKERTLHLFSTR